MSKRPIYFMPGLAASPKIFEKLQLPENKFELHYLNWIKPLSIEETMANYAMRMCDEIKHEKPILIGVSFGGILVQEIAKYLDVEKVIIISSVKSHYEFPTNFKFAKKLRAYKLFPTKVVSNFEKFAHYFIGKSLKKKAKMYQKYLSERDELYLKWSIQNTVQWEQETPKEDIVHIHGTKDHIFPHKNIKDFIKIKNGTHAMVLIKAKEISKIIETTLTKVA
ncbi:alpha/beta hydrolase [Polaribacter sp.]|nr:alpha/beta hydrolase [Polaribacter sp.]